MSIIEKIYSNFQPEKDEECVEKALDEYYNEAKKIVPEDKFLKLESVVGELAAASEKQGFIYGFKLAMQICNESLISDSSKGNQV